MKDYVYFETFGCSANLNNSEILKGILTQTGYQITNNQNIAEIIILNTCVVKQKTENKIKRKIQDLNSSNKLTIITGCMPDIDSKSLLSLNKNIILLGTHHLKDISNLIKKYKENKLNEVEQKNYLTFQKEEKINLPKIPANKLISIVQISEGCLGNCNFCKTVLTKGKLFSYPQDKILKSIESDLQQGAKEIWITSQGSGNYGLDRGKQELPELLNKILSLKYNFKLRLGMMDPNFVYRMLDKLIEVYKNPKMYKFLHIPIQSGSNKVLKDMNRVYKIELVEKVIKRFKEEFPELTLSTDVIIGYPTETELDFNESYNFVQKYEPDVFNLSKMSIHKGTNAQSLKPLPINIINNRTTKIMNLQKDISKTKKEKFKNKKMKVLINKKIGPNFYESRDDNYNIILLNSNENILGKRKDVRIKDSGVYHMVGEII